MTDRSVTVVLEDAPIVVLERATEHQADLIREFTLLAMGVASAETRTQLPVDLDHLIAELDLRDPEAEVHAMHQREEAAARGESLVTLRINVPPEAGPAALRLRDALDRADEYCRSGELLTLAPHSDVVALRQWYLEEFDRQIRGERPLSWPDYLAKHSLV